MDLPPEKIKEIDISERLTEEQLQVYSHGVPPNDITTTIQDHFVRLAQSPEIHDLKSLERYREAVKDFLVSKTFRAFPTVEVPFDLRLEFQDRDFAKYGRQNYSFVSEAGWRLNFSLLRRQPADKNAPLLLVLINPEAERYQHYGLSSGIADQFNVVYLETRGVGETGWSPSLQWHIRRAAAWTGRTIASMRVYDVIRCLDVLTQLPGIDSQQIYMAAEGEMVAVASYAALLNGNIAGLIIKDPPATQNKGSEPSGRGEAIEMLNCLRVTDLPQVTGLMFPRKIISVGKIPDTYHWVEKLYARLNKTQQYIKVESLSDWQPKN
ncbi:MAG: hypothetical protein IPL46_33630 [Saprospiraceae bacterium]|nr:hypothetical protein [Saprospiraceae bacterium]